MQPIALPAFTDNYIWVIPSRDGHELLCIDPGTAAPVLTFNEQNPQKLAAILLTHHHPDHIDGVHDLVLAFPDCEIYGVCDPRLPPLTHDLIPGKSFTYGGYHWQILNTPGHTSTHICYYEAELGWLFCGDTLFSAGCGRVFDGTIEELFQSLQQLKALPSSTQIFCAHEYTYNNLRFAQWVEPQNQEVYQAIKRLEQHPTECSLPSTIAHELQVNPFFRLNEPAVQAFAQQFAHAETPLEIFRTLRAQKNIFK